MKRILFLALPLAAACSSVPDLTSKLTPYRIDVRQGNFVTQEMAAQLKPGQTMDQVRFILGTPLVTDLFHADRWDYVYRFQPGHGEASQRRMAVYFVDGKLARVTGDVVPEGRAEAPAPPAQQTIEITAPAQSPSQPANQPSQ